MSIFGYRLKYFWQTAVALLMALLTVGCVCVLQISRFSDIDGEHIYYLNSASSQGLRKESLSIADFFNVRGESVRFVFSKEAETENFAEDFAEEIAKKYGATILLKEEVAGVTSYYGYTSKWADGVLLNGKKINLHIALSIDENANQSICVIGSPIIFDGY